MLHKIVSLLYCQSNMRIMLFLIYGQLNLNIMLFIVYCNANPFIFSGFKIYKFVFVLLTYLPCLWILVLFVILCLLVCLMVLNATFNNISVISWQSSLLEKTGGPRENHRPVASHWQTLSHNVVHLTCTLIEIRTHKFTTSVVIGTDCIGSCKSNYHTITATTAPVISWERSDI